MALWLTVVIALTCLGGLATPGPVPHSRALKELIEELVNITRNQVSACGQGPAGEGDSQGGCWSWSWPGRLSLVLR